MYNENGEIVCNHCGKKVRSNERYDSTLGRNYEVAPPDNESHLIVNWTATVRTHNSLIRNTTHLCSKCRISLHRAFQSAINGWLGRAVKHD